MKKITVVTLMLFGILLSSGTLYASTEVGGPIRTDATWDIDGSPYTVTSNIKVFEGATLTIGPGVTVQFEGDYEFEINGQFIARGTADQPILITSNLFDDESGERERNGSFTFSETAIGASYDDDETYIEGSAFEYVAIQSLNSINFNGASAYLNNIEHTNSKAIIYSVSGSVYNSKFNNNSGTNGGAIFSVSPLSFVACSFENNSASEGGAIYASTLSLKQCTFNNNFASKSSGAVFSSSSIISNCAFLQNSSSGSGGAISSSSSLSLSDCTFANNSSSAFGGAIVCHSNRYTLTLSNTTFTNNASAGGNAIYYCADSRFNDSSYYSSITLYDCIFINNLASGSNSEIYYNSVSNKSSHSALSYSSSLTLSNCTFTNSSASGTGGGVFNSSGYGGAIYYNSSSYGYNSSDSSLTLSGCSFTNNTAFNGGAIYYHSNGQFKESYLNGSSKVALSDCTFTACSASDEGGAIYSNSTIKNSSTLLTNCRFLKNFASNSGGAISSSTSLTLSDCLFNSNMGKSIIKGGTIETNDCTIVGNSSIKDNNDEILISILGGSLHFSNIFDNSGFKYSIQSNSSNINATNNYWGTIDENEINQILYDYYDDTEKGEIEYYPYLTEFNTDAPAIPDGLISPYLKLSAVDEKFVLKCSQIYAASGYKLYYAPYPNAETIGSINMGTQTEMSLEPWTGLPFYIAIVAVDADGNESELSNLHVIGM